MLVLVFLATYLPCSRVWVAAAVQPHYRSSQMILVSLHWPFLSSSSCVWFLHLLSVRLRQASFIHMLRLFFSVFGEFQAPPIGLEYDLLRFESCSVNPSGRKYSWNWKKWANAHIWWHLARWRGVLFKDESWFSLFRAHGRQCVLRRVGERFADVDVVDRVAHGGSGFMVWAGVCYGQQTQVHLIDAILNAQRYCDEILWPIVVPFIHDHHLMLQHDNARPHVARICTQFLEAENIPVLAWPAYSPDMSPIEHVWDALDMTRIWYVYDSVFQFLPISSNFAQPLKRSGPTFHRPQSTTWSTLCEGDVRQMVVTSDTDWFSDHPPIKQNCTFQSGLLLWPA